MAEPLTITGCAQGVGSEGKQLRDLPSRVQREGVLLCIFHDLSQDPTHSPPLWKALILASRNWKRLVSDAVLRRKCLVAPAGKRTWKRITRGLVKTRFIWPISPLCSSVALFLLDCSFIQRIGSAFWFSIGKNFAIVRTVQRHKECKAKFGL